MNTIETYPAVYACALALLRGKVLAACDVTAGNGLVVDWRTVKNGEAMETGDAASTAQLFVALVGPYAALESAARLCVALGTDGLRGELTLIRAARALASLEGDKALADSHLRRVAPFALSHRLRRNPLDEAGSTVRVSRAVNELFAA